MVEVQRSQQQQDTQLNTQKDYAYYLTKNAEMNVFVLRNNPPPDRKRPVYDWTIYQTACPTLARIDKWFNEENPNYNIAIPMGFSSGCIAFDIDGPTARQRIEGIRLKMSANLRPAFDNTMMNKTGSGGIHMVFRLEDYNDMIISKISTKELWKDNNEHSQIKMQANGAYIMFAHSMHPNGNYYEWNGKRPALLTENELLELIRLITGRANEKIPLNWSLEWKYDKESDTSDNNNGNSSTIPNAPSETIQLLYDLIAPCYLPGDRNDVIYYLSGYMRKDGAFTLADCETLATMLCELSEYCDEDLESTLEKVGRAFEIPIEKLKGKSGLYEKLIQNIDVESMSPEDVDKRHTTYKKICEIVSKNAKRNRPETLIEGCTIMELAGANSDLYMTVLSKDSHEDKATDSIRPIRIVAPVYPVRHKKDETKIIGHQFGYTILNAAPIAPIKKVYDPLFELQKYEIIFEYVSAGNAIKTKVIGPYTKQELIDYLKNETDFVYSDKMLASAINQVIAGFERRNMIVERTETETEGLIWDNENNKLYLSKRKVYKPTPEECKAAIKVIEETQKKFYMNRIPERPLERKRFAHFLKIGLVSVVDFARRQNGAAAPNKSKFISRQDLAGFANAGKSYGYAGLALRLYRLPVDGSSSYIISAGSVETEARFIEQTKWTTFPVIFDDIDWISNWEGDRRAMTIIPLAKNQAERTNPRDIQSVENKKRHLPSCAYIMITHNSELVKEDGFSRRYTGHEFVASDAKTEEEINEYNDWFNEHGYTFGYLGDFAIWYYLNNQDVLYNDWQTIAKQILIEFYNYASLANNEVEKLAPPEWLLSEVVESATSQEGLIESRRVSIINTLHDVVLNQQWRLSTSRKDIVSWIIQNLRKDVLGKPVEVAPDVIDEVTMSASMEEKLRAIAELNLVPYVKWHKKKEMVCIGGEFVRELKKRDVDRISLKQIESYCPQLKYDEHVRLGDGYSNKQKMLTITVEDFAKMLAYTDSPIGGPNHQTTIMMRTQDDRR